jgi:predicted porin
MECSSAVNIGYQTAQAQQRVAVTGGYTFNSRWSVTASYSNVQYIPGIDSKFLNTAIFNTGGVVLHFTPSPVWNLAAGYSYTRATRANGITDPATYQQISLAQYYFLSKRTSLYFMEAFQRARGNTLYERYAFLFRQPVCSGRRHRSQILSTRSAKRTGNRRGACAGAS